MNLHPVLLVLLVASVCVVRADEHGGSDHADVTKPLNESQYLICLSEYTLDQAVPTGVSEAEILNMIRKSGAIPVETVRMTAVADTDSMVKFGRRVAVATGKVNHGDTISRQTEFVDIGTQMQMLIASHSKGVVADVSFTTSRLDGDRRDDSPPDVITNTIQSTQIFVLGKERLLSTRSTGDTSYIVMSVREIP